MIILTIIILITMLTSALPLSNVLTLYAQPGVRVVASRPQASVTTIAACPTCDPNKNANCRANITSTTTLSGNNPAIPAHATPTTNPLPGIDIGNAYWTTDPTVIVSTNPNTPQSQSYILQLKNGIIDYRNALKSKSGNPNAWNINVQDGKQYYSDSQYVPPGSTRHICQS